MTPRARRGPKTLSSPREIFREESPDGSALAVVEDDGCTLYLYLQFAAEGVPLRSAWIRNLGPAPDELDRTRMSAGLGPLMPARFCAHPRGGPALDRRRLRVVWLPAGDGVALFEDARMLAAIAPCANHDCRGHSRDAVGRGPLARAVTGGVSRIFAEAEKYWARWARGRHPWETHQTRALAALEARFGGHERYFAIDGGRWPPKALVQHRTDRTVILTTIGMALRPQPSGSSKPVRPRIELGMVLPPWIAEKMLPHLREYVAAQSALPWARQTWLGHGHTIPCDGLRELTVARDPLTHVVLADARTLEPKLKFPSIHGRTVTPLWLVPITTAECERARREGSAAILASVVLPRPAVRVSPPGA